MLTDPRAYEQEFQFEETGSSEYHQPTLLDQHDMENSDPGHLLVSGTAEVTYVSPTFFALIRKEISEINDLLQSRQGLVTTHVADDPPLEAQRQENASSVLSAGSTGRGQSSVSDLFPRAPALETLMSEPGRVKSSVDVGELITGLPSAEQSEMLIQAYMVGYHTIYPMFHGPSFRRKASSTYQL